MHHQYGISLLIPETSFSRKTSGGFMKGQLFFQVIFISQGICYMYLYLELLVSG